MAEETTNITEEQQNTNNSGYIYLIIEREFINSNQEIYRLGKTKKTIQALSASYPLSSRICIYILCNDYNNIEKELYKLFKEHYKQRLDIGYNYFEGNSSKMKGDIMNKANN